MKRPVGVWIVSGWAAFSVTVQAIAVYAWLSPNLHNEIVERLPPAERYAYSSITTFDHLVFVVLLLCTATGGILLFRLRRTALSAFIGIVACKMLLDVWQFWIRGYIFQASTIHPVRTWINLAGSWMVVGAVVIYTHRLAARGILTNGPRDERQVDAFE